MPYSAPSKLNFFSNLIVAYAYIEYSTYQFSEKSKGGGVESKHPLPTPVLAVLKKRGPERIKGSPDTKNKKDF